MIPYGRQDIQQTDIDAVVSVLQSDFLTQGPVVPAFEAAIADYCGASHAVATNSATSALHVACMALGLGPGDWLWTSPVTFVASANCALYCGASVDFVDIDIQTFNMCAMRLEEKLVRAERDGCLPKVVVPVHLAGQSCDMAAIYKLSTRFGFKIIEDASHAIGGRYQGVPIGGCQYSDVTVFSFHPVKIVTSAEGGMATANDAALADAMRLFRSHAVTRDSNVMRRESPGPWYYEQVGLGYNYRMTELQAALGLSQFARLDAYISRRHEIASVYDDAFAGLPLETPYRRDNQYSAFHLYIVQVEATRRYSTFNALLERGVGVNVHYIPVHTQPHYQDLGFSAGDFPASEHYYAQAISLPMFPTLTEQQQEVVVQSLVEALAA